MRSAHKKQSTGRLASIAQKLGLGMAGSGLRRTGAITAVLLAAWLLFVGLFYVWTRMRLVQLGYDIVALEGKNERLKKRQTELLLEVASLQSPGELERQARKKAGLSFPAIGKVVHVP